MKSLPFEVQQQLNTNYRETKDQISSIFLELMNKTEGTRLIKSILYLANKDFEKLKYYIDKARIDSRDVIYWAEYDESGQQIRSFNNLND